MVTLPGRPAAPYQSMVDKVCVTHPDVQKARQERLEALQRQFPGVEFKLEQSGPVARSIGGPPPPPSSGNPEADAAAATANSVHTCDGMKFVAKKKGPSP